jgi:hypothetical protein
METAGKQESRGKAGEDSKLIANACRMRRES